MSFSGQQILCCVVVELKLYFLTNILTTPASAVRKEDRGR